VATQFIFSPFVMVISPFRCPDAKQNKEASAKAKVS
jgi:hypothetical protein